MNISQCAFSKILDKKPDLFKKFIVDNYSDFLDKEKSYLSLVKEQYIEEDTGFGFKLKKPKKYFIKTQDRLRTVELEYYHHIVLNYVIENYEYNENFKNIGGCPDYFSPLYEFEEDGKENIIRHLNDLIEVGLVLKLSNIGRNYVYVTPFRSRYLVNLIRIKFLLEDKLEYNKIIDERVKAKYTKIVEIFLRTAEIEEENANYLLTHLIETQHTMNEELSDSDCFWVMGALTGLTCEEIERLHSNLS